MSQAQAPLTPEAAATNRADTLLTAYGMCHQNATNKAIHWVCVPLIVLSLLGLLWDLPFPQMLSTSLPWLNWSIMMIALSMSFYVWMSPAIAVGMALTSATVIALLLGYERLGIGPVWVASLIVFVLAWIGQFIGHKIEGAKPAFFDDLQFLLIGPAWLLGFIYRKLGIRY